VRHRVCRRHPLPAHCFGASKRRASWTKAKAKGGQKQKQQLLPRRAAYTARRPRRVSVTSPTQLPPVGVQGGWNWVTPQQTSNRKGGGVCSVCSVCTFNQP
jgi:hypothetical protein